MDAPALPPVHDCVLALLPCWGLFLLSRLRSRHTLARVRVSGGDFESNPFGFDGLIYRAAVCGETFQRKMLRGLLVHLTRIAITVETDRDWSVVPPRPKRASAAESRCCAHADSEPWAKTISTQQAQNAGDI